jgi:hypothetical protein
MGTMSSAIKVVGDNDRDANVNNMYLIIGLVSTFLMFIKNLNPPASAGQL